MLKKWILLLKGVELKGVDHLADWATTFMAWKLVANGFGCGNLRRKNMFVTGKCLFGFSRKPFLTFLVSKGSILID